MANEPKGIWKVIGASSVGTLIEWYDFYIFGSLATIISAKFFPPGNPTASFLATLATFAAGFIVRPFGALVFGRLGDIIGRKHTFLLTLVIMGVSTFLIGCIPAYEDFKWAPAVVLVLRLLQGLALGGEYGGAATYVAEHAPEHKRGFYTSWIQTTATLGLFVSLIVIIATQKLLSPEDFNDWGWRLPFLLSILLVIVSIVIRMKMKESPLFASLKKEGKTSVNPLKESFGHKLNLKMVLLALFGATMGQGVVWYTGQFYAQTFMLRTCNIEATQANTWIGIGLLLATPFFVFFGWLSDKIGRKWIMMAGMLLAVICYRPIFDGMYQMSDVNRKEIASEKQIQFTKSANPRIAGDSLLTLKRETIYTDGSVLLNTNEISKKDVEENMRSTVVPAPRQPKITNVLKLDESFQWKFVGLIFILVLFVTMVYGPIAAFLVELFPTRIRYTSMSLPYHIGNGVFGGLVPFIGILSVELTKTAENPAGNYLAGLLYPMGVAAVCFIIGAIYLSNKKPGHE
ncbi:MAG: sugar transport protein [Chitinophagaceae bacterium]|nr:sugar transport protein [Chitinophagaceae bacterium]